MWGVVVVHGTERSTSGQRDALAQHAWQCRDGQEGGCGVRALVSSGVDLCFSELLALRLGLLERDGTMGGWGL